MVCNGGSPTVTQALLAGKPVLGLCSNMDQFLNMRSVEASGAGIMLRADRIGRVAFGGAVERLRGQGFGEAASALAIHGAGLDPITVLIDAIERLAM